MLNFTRTKTLLILGTVLLGVLLALPNILPPAQQDWLRQYTIARPMTLGLDLQGGAYVVLEIEQEEFRGKLISQLAGDVRTLLRQEKLANQGVQRTTTGATVTLKDAADADRIAPEMQRLTQQVDAGIFSTGLPVTLFDITRAGTTYTFAFNETGVAARKRAAVEQVIKVFSRRLDETGVAEVSILQQGLDRIVIQMPGVKDPDKLIEDLSKTGQLSFQLLCNDQPTSENDRPPPDCESFPFKEQADRPLWVQTSPLATVSGADLTDAQPGFDQNNQSMVTFRLNQKGAVKFGKLTADNVGKPFAIVLDGIVQSAPNINEPILGGSGQITGNFSVDDASNLAVILRSGALPAKLTPVEKRTVGPSLGADSIRAGLIASIVGLIGILIFTTVAYGLFGVFANVALVANLVILIALMSVFGFTLTLPGIAGIVLTMGMAVDSNVLVFERIREEWRNGRTALNAIDTGFRAALATVLDANVTTLIAAIVLFGVGSGPVRGFAVTLVIGVLTTMFTAFTLTRLIIAWWVRRTKPKEVPL